MDETTMTKTQLKAAFAAAGTRISQPIRWAIEDILLKRMTWRDASIQRGVTESGILKAMRRLGLR